MRDLSENLERLERELRRTPAEQFDRLGELLRERDRLIRILAAGLPLAPPEEQQECYERLCGHRAAGAELQANLRCERAALVEAWGESARERELVRLFGGAQSSEATVVELG